MKRSKDSNTKSGHANFCSKVYFYQFLISKTYIKANKNKLKEKNLRLQISGHNERITLKLLGASIRTEGFNQLREAPVFFYKISYCQ